MIHQLLEKLDRRYGFKTASAHCDIPCGIYDPISAQIDALTVVRMLDLLQELDSKTTEHNSAYFNTLARYITVKEEHAEKVKQEIRVIWGDYFKSQHLEKHPRLHELTHKIMQLASKVRQSTDRAIALELVEAVNEFAGIFWDTKGVTVKRAKAPYAPSLELVYPVL